MKYCVIDTMLNEINPQRRSSKTNFTRAAHFTNPLADLFRKKISRCLRDIFLEASPRLELGVRILQTLALPLGYDAVSYRVMPILCVERETGFGPATFTLAR